MRHTTMEHRDTFATGYAGHDDLQWQRVQSLTEHLKNVLEQNDGIFDDENIRRQMTMLERWLDYCSRDIVDVDTFAKTSTALLTDLRDRLRLAAEELLRFDNEGGVPASKEQAEKNDALLVALRRSEKLLSNIEELFK